MKQLFVLTFIAVALLFTSGCATVAILDAKIADSLLDTDTKPTAQQRSDREKANAAYYRQQALEKVARVQAQAAFIAKNAAHDADEAKQERIWNRRANANVVYGAYACPTPEDFCPGPETYLSGRVKVVGTVPDRYSGLLYAVRFRKAHFTDNGCPPSVSNDELSLPPCHDYNYIDYTEELGYVQKKYVQRDGVLPYTPLGGAK